MKILYLIPARGGSKGLPGKNIKLLSKKPLLYYSIDFARHFTGDENIFVSTDDDTIINTVNNYNLTIPFKRPDALATDTAGSWEVICHAIESFEKNGLVYDCVVLLQPTTPFRKKEDLIEALKIFSNDLDMVVSVKESDANPYYNLFEENSQCYLEKCNKNSNAIRRQDVPPVYQYNGSLYVINVKSIKKYSSFTEFKLIKKIKMDSIYSIDIDSLMDFEFCEFLLSKNYVKEF